MACLKDCIMCGMSGEIVNSQSFCKWKEIFAFLLCGDCIYGYIHTYIRVYIRVCLYLYVYKYLVQDEKFFGWNKISLISVKTVKYMKLEIWWVDGPRIPALVKIRPYQGWGLRCKVSHPDAICSSCHNAEARKAESRQGEFQHFFFFFKTFMWIFLWGVRRPIIFLGCYPFILELIRWPHSV